MVRIAVLALSLCALVLLPVVVGALGGPRLERAAGIGLILLIVVLGLNVFIGNSGVFSFGHMTFMGIGAYVTVILTMSPQQKRFQLPDLPVFLMTIQVTSAQAAVISGCAAMGIAIVAGLPLMRLSGLTASLATVAILITAVSVFRNLERFTRGSSGVILDTPSPSLVVLYLWACAGIFAALMFRSSRTGSKLAASREDEVAAKAVGIRVWWERGVAWAVSAFLVGVAGSLFAQFSGSVNPDTFFLDLTFVAISMLVVGGMTSVSGAVAGTLLLSIALELMRWFERGIDIGPLVLPARAGLSEVGLALVLLGMLILRPSGVTSGREFSFEVLRRWARARRGGDAA